MKKIVIVLLVFLALMLGNVSPVITMTGQELRQRMPFLDQPIAQLPTLSCTPALVANGSCQQGQMQAQPQDYVRLGMLGRTAQASLMGMANATGVNLNQVSVGNLQGILKNVTVQDLVTNQLNRDPRFNWLTKNLADVPLLQDIASKFNLPSGLKVQDALQQSSAFANALLSSVSPGITPMNISQAIPNFTSLPFTAINAMQNARIGDFGSAFNLGSRSISQFPINLGSNLDLIKFNFAATGERKVLASRNACGGIPQPSARVVSQTCTGNCKGFEILSATNRSSALHGSWCVEHNVPDGHGPLCTPSSCQAKSGNFPVGREIAIHVQDITNRDQAILAGSFQTCLYLPFVTDPWTCTAHVLPVPGGIPFMQIGRNSSFPFSAPSTLAASPQSPVLAIDNDRAVLFARWGLLQRDSVDPRGAHA